MADIKYQDADLSGLKYIKFIYSDLNDESHEVRTEIDYIGNKFVSIYFKPDDDFNIKYPQEVELKFITDKTVYVCKTTLCEIKKTRRGTFLTISAPQMLTIQQNRKYYRIKLDRVCILVATDKDGHSTVFMSRLVDVSAGGVLIHQLETMFSNDYITIDPLIYDQFNIVLILGTNIILKMTARYVRQEIHDKSYRYAFEFIDSDAKKTNIISKFVTQEQIQQLKVNSKYK